MASSVLPGVASSLQASAPHLSTAVGDVCEGSCLRSWKFGFAAILLAEGLLFAHIVYIVKRVTGGVGPKFNAIIRIGNALSAGIFLSAGLLHIFPEAVELLAGRDVHGHGEEHVRMLTVGLRALSKLVRDEDDDEDHHEGEEGHDEDHDEDHDEEGHSAEFPWAYLIAGLAFYFLFAMEKIVLPKIFPTSLAHDGHAVHTKDIEEQNDEKDLSSEPQGIMSGAFVQGLIQVVAISLHSLFESMALGISSSFDVMLSIFIAIASHRWATGAAVSFKLIRNLRYFPFLVLVTLFSSAIPIGIAIGAALSALSTTVQGVLFAISAGTFLYLGGFDLMVEEFVENKEWKLRKFLFVMLGAAIITVITVVLSVAGVHG